MSAPIFADLALQYRELFAQCQPQPANVATAICATILTHRDRYQALAAQFSNGLPWFGIALLHRMECDGNFTQHLHNGDPLAARTKDVPAGRPVLGEPPFTWEYSALDALKYDRWDQVPPERWADVAGLLYQLEAYNGWGPRLYHHQRTAYLWGKSNLEQPGKYVGDGQWNPTATGDQVGAAVILKALVTSGAVAFPALPA